MSALRDKVLLREAIQEILLEKPLSPYELTKPPYDDKRLIIFGDMVRKGEPFPLEKGGEVVIEPTAELLQILGSTEGSPEERAKAVDAALRQQGLSLHKLRKPPQMKTTKGGGSKVEDPGVGNEMMLADTVNKQVAETNGPITVWFGKKWDVPSVLSAEWTGKKDSSKSKPDVILHLTGGEVFRVSVKGAGKEEKTPSYGPVPPETQAVVASELQGSGPPDPRLKQKPDSMWQTVVGPEEKPVRKDVSFPIDPADAEQAVFHRGHKDEVDIIVWGDLSKPEVKGNEVRWPNVQVYTTIEDLPSEQKPTGVLRTGDRSRSLDKKFKGIRPIVSTAKRAKSAVPVKGT